MNVTVYVPEDLGKRMEAAKDKLNLSRIFQDAVETRLLRLQPMDEEGIERLSASKAQSDKKWYEEGERDGMKQALNSQPYDWVAIVAKLDDHISEVSDADTELVAAIRGEERDSPEFWDEVFGQGWESEIPNTDAYARGYIHGMRQVFDQLPS